MTTLPSSLQREWNRLRSSQLARNISWLVAGQGAGVMLQAGYFIVLARLLGRTEYGIYVGAVALVSIVSQYSSMGAGILFLRYVSQDARKFPFYWGNILVTTLGVGAILVLALWLLGPLVIGSSAAAILLPVAIGDCICGQLTLCAGQVFQAFERMKITAVLNLLTNLLRLLIAVFLLVFRHHATAMEWAIAALTVSAFAVISSVTVVLAQVGRPRVDLGLITRRLSEGVIYAVSGSTTSLYNDLDKTMLSHYGMNAANGIYTMAYRVVDICTIPVRSVQGAAVPRFFRAGTGGPASTRSYAIRIVKRTALLGLAAAVGSFICAPLISLLAGPGFAQSVGALRWLCLIPLFRSFHLSAGDAITGAGSQRVRLGTQFAASLLNFGLNLWLIPAYGWLGAAWASLMTDGSLAVMNWTALTWLARSQPLAKLAPAL
jgi:O-antigen/teichoic acid export membrane protein